MKIKTLIAATLLSFTVLTVNAVVITPAGGGSAHNSWEAKGAGIPYGYIIPDTGGRGFNYTGEKANGGSYYAPKGDGISNFPLDGTWYVDASEVAVSHGGYLDGVDRFDQYGVGDNWYMDARGPYDCSRVRSGIKTLQETCKAPLRSGFSPNQVNVSRFIIDPIYVAHTSHHQRFLDIQYKEDGHLLPTQPSFLEENQFLARRVLVSPEPSTLLDPNSVPLDVIAGERIINSADCWVANVYYDDVRYTEYQCLATLYSTYNAAGINELEARNVTAVYRVNHF